MDHLCMSLCTVILCLFVVHCSSERFDEHFKIDWGGPRFKFFDYRREARILIDQFSGGGFISKSAYGSGNFQMSLKIPKNSKGIVATFYLSSNAPEGGNHDEVDFELLGSDTSTGYILHTNLFAQDVGHREQQFKFWFDPTKAFHDYRILWNSKLIVFYVDNIPIRVFKNDQTKYPRHPMYVRASLWNAIQWLGPVEWSNGPFYAHYRDFSIAGCTEDSSKSNPKVPNKCASLIYPWNKLGFTKDQKRLYNKYKKKYITSDYCNQRKAKKNFPEC